MYLFFVFDENYRDNRFKLKLMLNCALLVALFMFTSFSTKQFLVAALKK